MHVSQEIHTETVFLHWEIAISVKVAMHCMEVKLP
ncbi:hypothetical protein ANAPC5_00555 [Anaplasma phagocytophilum]|nr:hypothetical protein ANAPC2_01205 [Anaplasma phagocytophilum]SBO33436.1 hypothetical protein ANAPC3_01224 [Anaplasma phagocytophilum]SBO33565.1 hypothetical protein ANAPC4_01206 [Anaplasma phagocytophilum]SCV63403.1 hypothetical protein ANAPC5_00555 [Anaplasma phagocytophilum]